MLLQTNSYIVPKDKRTEHARLLQRFRQCLARLGCEHFEAYEQVGANWSSGESTGRFVQLMRFRDRKQQQEVQAAERSDPQAQALIKEFCELINFPYQQQQGLFAVGFYQGIMALGTSVRQPPPVMSINGEAPAPPIPATDEPVETDSAPEIQNASAEDELPLELSPETPPPLPTDHLEPDGSTEPDGPSSEQIEAERTR
jgi:hypothetical protein